MKSLFVLAGLGSVLAAEEQLVDRPRARPIPPASQNLQTGPAAGARVPDFTLPDQSGRSRTLASLMGKKGLLLYFVRSADW